MESVDLAYFLAVAQTNSMARAAEALDTVQSNVSGRIQRLERDLGSPLFRRHSRGVTLTDAGHRLLPFASEMQTLLKEAVRSVRDTAGHSCELRIGGMETTLAARLGRMLPRFVLANPSIEFTMEPGTSQELLDRVLRRELDGAFVCGPVAHPRLRSRAVFREELALVAGPSTESLGQLFAAPEQKVLVMRRGCAYRLKLEQLMLARGVATARVSEYGTIDGILACAAAGLGISLLPIAFIEAYRGRYDFSYWSLPRNEGFVETMFTWPALARTPRGLQAFLTFIDDQRAWDDVPVNPLPYESAAVSAFAR